MNIKKVFMAVAFLCLQASVFAQFSGSGSGTENDPYKIYNADQLHQVRNYLDQDGVVFKLMKDLDLADWISNNNGSQGWEPIGVASQPFKGVFDGNNKRLTGFNISRGSLSYVGFFGYIAGATIKNLTIEGSVTGGSYVGAFVGRGTGNCTMTGLTHIGNITATSYAGHIAGQYSGNLSNASANGNITATSKWVGGIVGYHDGSGKTISSVTVTGDVSAGSSSSYVGGIAGYSFASFSYATVTGNVTGGSITGGICGEAYAAISNARIKGVVSGTDYVGGICGKSNNSKDLSNCYSYCDVTGTGSYVGGVLGQGNGNISQCLSFGNINGAAYVGGVIGCFGQANDIPAFIRYYNSSNYISDKFAGFSTSEKSVKNSCAIGNIVATGNYVGGICGYNYCLSSWRKNFDKSLTLESTEHLHDKIEKGVRTDVTGTFYSYKYTAQLTKLTLSDSYYSGNISGADYVGGIIGSGENVTVTRNYSNAYITGKNEVGGIVGSIKKDGGIQYYDYNSSTPTTVTSSCASAVSSNMAMNSSVIATSAAGRIYGSKEDSGVTIATNGATDDNRALETGRLIISGVTQEVADSEKDGVNNGIAYFMLRQNYVSHGWNFNSDWTILDTECYPYKPFQAAPPTIDGNLVSGATSMSGNSTDGGTIFVTIGKNAEQSALCSGNAWSLDGLTLQSGSNVSLYAVVDGKENSYRTTTTVGFPGSGTEADPWRVYTAEDLQGVFKAGYYKQMNDINLASWISTNSKTAGWVPVGYSGTDPVVYDGDNHKVTGLWINSTEDYAGLFSSFTKGTIRNLTVEATAKQVKGGNYVGIVIGRIGTGILENVHAKGNVSASNYVGGVAGYTSGTGIRQLSYTGQLTATGRVGGITSYANTDLTECEVTDVVIKASASDYVGGLVAFAPFSSVSKSKVTGTITRSGTSQGAYVGGLAGRCKAITECSTDVTITSSSVSGFTAGLSAYCTGTVKLSCSAGSVTTTGTGASAGGLVAKTDAAAVLEDCYSTANVSGNQYAAGLVAYNYGQVNRCYACGNISSVYYGAGLVGENDGASAITTNSFAFCPKIEVSNESGWGQRVVGNFKNNAPEPSKDNLFAWKDMQVSLNGVPRSITDDNLNGTALTTAQTKDRDNYETLYWDFDEVWTMPADGYPVLTWQAVQSEPDVAKGDLNGDGEVSISDVVLIIDVMAGTITDADKVAAADVNGDGDVTITDCVAAIDLMAAQTGANARMRTPEAADNNDYIRATINNGELGLTLNNEHRYTAFQMIVSMPTGMTLARATMDPARGEDHLLVVRSLGEGRYLLAGFSFDNEELNGNSGQLLTIATSGQAVGDIVISDVQFADVQAEAFRLAGVRVGTSATGISEMEYNVDTQYFDLQGRHVNTPSKGLYIKNGKKVYLK